MEKRLSIAKRLLSDKGVIFISIDDNEVAQLKMLCDEIFGESNFVAKFDWRKKTGANDAKDVAVVTETVYLYTKNHVISINERIWNRDKDSINKNRYKLSDDYISTRGKYYLDTLDRGGLQYTDSMNFGIKAPDGGIIYPNGRSCFMNDGWIWKWSKDKIEWGLENSFLEFVPSKKSKGSNYTIKYKVYELVDNDGALRTQAGRAFMNLILDPINQQGNNELKSIFENKVLFNNPKPIGLLQYLFKILRNKDVTILDFFAGSGTTLHAVMKLNEQDGGHRKCILATNNENNICEEVTYERNKRVIQGYKSTSKVTDTLLEKKITLTLLKKADKLLEKADKIKAAKEGKYAKIKNEIKDGVYRLIGEYNKSEKIPGLTNNSLRYYRTSFLPRERSNKAERELMLNATGMLCIKEDIYHAEQNFGRFPTHPQLLKYFKDKEKHMLIIYREEIVKQVAEEIEQMDFDKPLIIYTFSTNNNPHTDEFSEVLDKVRLTALPKAIYAAYKDVLPEQTNLIEEGGEA